MQEVVITKSNRKDKRLKATFENKTIHFGYDKGKAFVDHNNKELKEAWIARHKVRGDFYNLEEPSGLAKGILWNKSNIKDSISNLNKKQSKYKFKIK